MFTILTEYTEKDLQDILTDILISHSEKEWIEFKENNEKPELIGEYISALANSACVERKEYAYLIYGIKDETKEVVGTKFDPKSRKIKGQELENYIATQLEPHIDFKIYKFKHNDKDIVMFIIEPPFNTPVKFNGIEYIRIGSYKKKLKDFPEKARKIWNRGKEREFEKGIALANVSADEVLKLIDYPNYFELMNLNLPDTKDNILEKFLEEGIIVKKTSSKYSITNLGAILFAKNLDNFEKLSRKAVRVIQYKGNNKLETIREQTGKKGYAVGFEGLIDYINGLLPTNEVIEKAFRKEVKMFPEIAIRELVANAIIHQDFTVKGSGPMVEIFEDRIEISNPGKPLIDTMRFIDHTPQSRNEKLASLMRRMNICEERGSGIDKVIASIELYQLPAPDFIEDSKSLIAILYAYKPLNKMDKADKIRACYQHCCLKYVSRDYMTNTTLRERFKIDKKNYSIASRIISETVSAELIKNADTGSKSKRDVKYVPIWA